MIRKFIAFVLVTACCIGLFIGCDAVSDITDNVLAAAKEELVNQIQAKVEEYKVTVAEAKSAVGKLNDEGGKYQFYCAFLVQTNAESSAEDCANAMGKLFGESGYVVQAGSKVESKHLVHKSITYDHTDFSEGNYYTVYVYVADISKVIDLNAIADAIKDAIPTETK